MSTLRINLVELAKVRDELGITSDSDLAARLQVNKSTVSRILSGQAEPGPRFIAAAVDRLPTTFDDLFVIAPDGDVAA